MRRNTSLASAHGTSTAQPAVARWSITWRTRGSPYALARILLLSIILAAQPATAQVFSTERLDNPQPSIGAEFGATVAIVGDLDADGIPDIAVGERKQFGRGTSRVYVFSGRDRSLLQTIRNPDGHADDLFGYSIVGVDDIDGDGTPDLVIGAPTQDADGALYLISGSHSTVIREYPSRARAFGVHTLRLPDLNSDGISELAVSNTSETVHIIDGVTGDVLRTLASPFGGTNQLFGADIALVGDMLYVSEPERRPGFGYLFRLSDGQLLRTFSSPEPSRGFGNPGVIGDVNGDGVPDLVLGEIGSGKAYTFSGRDGTLLHCTAGLGTGRIAGPGDLDGDGVPDYVIGDISGPGLLSAVSGRDGTVLFALNNPSGQNRQDFGFSVAGQPGLDLNGDGRVDLLVGVPGADGQIETVEPGHVYVFLSSADDDGDGVADIVEGAVNGSGDGDGDGVPDNRQSHIASLPTARGNGYMTLIATPGTRFRDVKPIGHLVGASAIVEGTACRVAPTSRPADVDLPVGSVKFTLDGIAPGSATAITVVLPPGVLPNTYYKFGPTPDNPLPHWYEFLFDGTTGAVIAGNVVTLYFVDGLRGDDDLVANGTIVDAGGPADGIAASTNLAITSIAAPPAVTIQTGRPVTKRLTVQIHNRGSRTEAIQDSAVLASLVQLSIQSLGACPAPTATLRPLNSSNRPVVLRPRQKLNAYFDVTFDCANDGLASTAKNPGHEDFSVSATVNVAALGTVDLYPADNVCPRSVPPGGARVPYGTGTLLDKGCGARKADGTLGGAILIDIVTRP